MKRKFRFTKDPLARLKAFYAQLTGVEETPETPAAPAEEAAESEKESSPESVEAVVEATSAEAAKSAGRSICRTHIGKVRATNQDAVIDAYPLVGVADGMGGHRGGEEASTGARGVLTELLRDKEPSQLALRQAIGAANRRLFLRQQEEENLAGMGTTLTVLWISDEEVIVGHVGDSRAYRMRDGKLTQLTRDHSMVAEMVREGMLTPEAAACHPMRNVITRAVGTEEGVEIDMMTEKRCAGDLWLVCSDGLYGMVDDDAMLAILRDNEPDEAADKLIEAALEAGGRDNISLAIFLDGEDRA
ncbi:MAG: Stp1/IreP family PP2C-type Ser/Thr phosphatase [Clostridia bacterium]|nr:Stp1/IreP family PP2C-type Ser/Thr phosphatase [Clostridia bacterium]